MKRRVDDNLQIIDCFLKHKIRMSYVESIYLGLSEFKTLKICYWIIPDRVTKCFTTSPLDQEVHTEKDLQRHISRLVVDLRKHIVAGQEPIIGFANIHGSHQPLTVAKLADLSRRDMR